MSTVLAGDYVDHAGAKRDPRAARATLFTTSAMRAQEVRSRFVTLELRDVVSPATAADVGFTRRPYLPAPGDELEVNTRRLEVVRTVVAPAGDTWRSWTSTRRGGLTDVDRSRATGPTCRLERNGRARASRTVTTEERRGG